MADPDYVLRLRHAEERIGRLNEQIDRFVKAQGSPFYFESDRAACQYLLKCGKIKTPPSTLGLDISECLFHLRCGLDYIAHRLGDMHSGPIPRADIQELRKPEFPIFGERSPGAQEMARKIGRAHPDAIRIIENIQPYLSGDYTVHPLWVLHELNNIDKHRMITSVVLSRQLTDVRVRNGKLIRARIQPRGPLVDGAVICFVKVEAENPILEPNVEVDFAIDVGFDDTPVVAYESVRGWLSAILEFVKRNVMDGLRGYL